MTLIVLIWLGCAAVGAAIGESKGRVVPGLILGLLLGVIGWVVIACLSATPEKIVERNAAGGERCRRRPRADASLPVVRGDYPGRGEGVPLLRT